jgi:ABC-type bacteriocin/lantibiotic exporter with double-glycine peptidase domain
LLLVRELIKNPSVLLLDEPTSALDLESRYIILSYLKEIKKDKIIISHDNDVINNSDVVINL